MTSLLITLLISLFGIPESSHSDIAFYDTWSQLPTHDLMQMGESYRNDRQMPDSALVCFSIVANRYYEEKHDKRLIEQAIDAMTHIAYLYMYDFYDYTKAVGYNTKAQQLALEHQCKDALPNIMLNNAIIEGLLNSYGNNYQFSLQILNNYKRVFNESLRQHDWNTLLVCYINMLLRTTFDDKLHLMRKEIEIVSSSSIPDSCQHLSFARALTECAKLTSYSSKDLSPSREVGGGFPSSLIQTLKTTAQQYEQPRYKALATIVANNFILSYYWQQKNWTQVLHILNENQQLAKSYNMTLHLLDAYNNLSSYYKENSNPQLATKYKIMYLEGKDNLINKKKLGNIQEAKLLFQLNQKNEQVKEMAYRQQNNRRLLVATLIFSTIITITLIMLLINYRRVQQRNRHLYLKSLEAIQADDEKMLLIEQLQQQLAVSSTPDNHHPTPNTQHPTPDTHHSPLNSPVSSQADSIRPSSPHSPLSTEPVELQKDSHTQQANDKTAQRQSQLLHKIFAVMETSPEIYSDNFSLPRLAELVGDKRNNVSEAINQQYNTNFNTLLNQYRIREACRRINDKDNYGNLTIESIGQSVGFRSRSSFTTVFKQIVGLTPSAYQKMAKKL